MMEAMSIEMISRISSNQRSMHDRISKLPDAQQHQVLSMLLLKSMARAGVLSKSWNNTLKNLRLNLSDLKFCKDFSSGKTPEEFVGSINLCLRLHGGNKVRRFCLVLHPLVHYNVDVVEIWVKFPLGKGVEEVELAFGCQYGHSYRYEGDMEDKDMKEKKRAELLGCLFGCKSLTSIKINRLDFRLPSDFTVYCSLTELCLKEVNLSNEMLQKLILACPSLEILTLREVDDLCSIELSSINLKFLAVLNCVCDLVLHIDAPHLRSFHFNAALRDFSSENLSSLVDAIVCALDYGDISDFSRIWVKISHVKILTLCRWTLWSMAQREENLLISFHNLQEMQILFEWPLDDEHLTNFYSLSEFCYAFA